MNNKREVHKPSSKNRRVIRLKRAKVTKGVLIGIKGNGHKNGRLIREKVKEKGILAFEPVIGHYS